MSTEEKTNKPLSHYNKFTLRNILYTGLKHWYLFIIIFIVVWGTKTYIIRYSVPKYQVWASIYIKGDKKTNGGAENFLEGMSILNSSKSVQNELEVIRSYQVIRKTVGALDMKVSYFVLGSIKEGELYEKSPITVQLDTSYSNADGTAFLLEVEDDKSYSLYKMVESSNIIGILSPTNTYDKTFVTKGRFGETCESEFFRAKIHKSPNLSETYKGDVKFYFKINNLDALAKEYQARLKLELINKYSNIVNMYIVGSVPDKDKDFLNQLMQTYITNGLTEKNEIVTNTIRFIDHQLLNINDSLKGAENQLQKFRSNGSIVTIKGTSEAAVERLNKLEDEQDLLAGQKQYYEYLLRYVQEERDIKDLIAPSTAGINDQLLSQLVSELVALISEQNNLPFSAKDKNPTYKMLELKIKNTKGALIENIKNLIASNDLFIAANQKKMLEVKQLLGDLPQKERDYIDIQRKLNLSDNIYNYLLEKRIEASIAKAANVPDSKIMNNAMLMGTISPNIVMINRYANIAITFLPIGLILFIIYIDSKMKGKDMLLSLSHIPVLGMVNHYDGKDVIPVLVSPKSRLSESIRSLRINLEFILPDKKGKIIGITSSISGEGKSFFSINLAASIASTGSKLVLIGADMRKPTLQNMINQANDKGLSSYLIKKASLEQVLCHTEVEGFDCILSGPIPPNPAELMASAQMHILLEELRKSYDYIIIDTPPVILVSDYFVLNRYIDANIFIARQNYTTVDMVKDISSLVTDKDLKNSFWVLNDVNKGAMNQYGYGYGNYGYGGYGYGYDYNGYGYYDEKANPVKHTWLGKIKRIFKIK